MPNNFSKPFLKRKKKSPRNPFTPFYYLKLNTMLSVRSMCRSFLFLTKLSNIEAWGSGKIAPSSVRQWSCSVIPVRKCSAPSKGSSDTCTALRPKELQKMQVPLESQNMALFLDMSFPFPCF